MAVYNAILCFFEFGFLGPAVLLTCFHIAVLATSVDREFRENASQLNQTLWLAVAVLHYLGVS